MLRSWQSVMESLHQQPGHWASCLGALWVLESSLLSQCHGPALCQQRGGRRGALLIHSAFLHVKDSPHIPVRLQWPCLCSSLILPLGLHPARARPSLESLYQCLCCPGFCHELDPQCRDVQAALTVQLWGTLFRNCWYFQGGAADYCTDPSIDSMTA